MKEKPILFSTEMVKAILDGKKTQTRRIIKPQPDFIDRKNHLFQIKCHYEIGMKMWVKETFCQEFLSLGIGGEMYRTYYKATERKPYDLKWISSIYMPRKLSRIMLKITEIKTERIQDITEEDAQAEGTEYYKKIDVGRTYKKVFKELWNSINEKRGYGWEANPWVWVIKFKKK